VTTSIDGSHHELVAATGIDDQVHKQLADLNWRVLFRGDAQKPPLVISDASSLERIGLKTESAPLIMYRLEHEDQAVGYTLLFGAKVEEKERDLLDLFCRLLAARISHDRSMEMWRRKDVEFSMIGEVAKRIFATGKVDDILPKTLEEAMYVFRSKRGSILLADSEDGRVTDVALRGRHTELTSKIHRLKPDSVSHRVFFEKTPLLVRDTDREFGRQTESRFPYSARSFISVPLRENGHALGVLHLTEREGDDAYTTWDLSLLDVLSGQAAAAIQKARLRDEIEIFRIQAMTDSLTGIYNRRFLDNCLVNEMSRANRFEQPFTVVMIDIDDFKVFNDELGHQCGDRILKELVDEIQKQVRSIDILARYGGEEFVLVLPGTELKGGVGIAEKIRSHVEATLFPSEKGKRKLTVSAGVSTFPDNALSPQDLLERADQALRQAKGLGKNMIMTWRES